MKWKTETNLHPAFAADVLDGLDSLDEVGLRVHLMRPKLIHLEQSLEIFDLCHRQPHARTLRRTTDFFALALRLEGLAQSDELRYAVVAQEPVLVQLDNDPLLPRRFAIATGGGILGVGVGTERVDGSFGTSDGVKVELSDMSI